MDYYGADRTRSNKVPKIKINNSCRFYAILAINLSLSILVVVNSYYSFSAAKEINTLRIYASSTDENIDLIKKELERGVKPRLMLIDRVITYQLPSAIIRAFEISHQDLRMSLAAITLDLKRVIELYKALLGFTDDWILSNNAQQLQCSWSPKRDRDPTNVHSYYDNATYDAINKIRDAETLENYDDYSIKNELNSIFKLFNRIINDFRNDKSRNQTEQIQHDYYNGETLTENISERLSIILDELMRNISRLINEQSQQELKHNLTFDHYLYNKHDELIRILKDIEVQNDYLVNQTLRLKKSIKPEYTFDHIRSINEHRPDFIFEPSTSYVNYYPGEHQLSIRDFYNVSIRKHPYKINLGNHRIKKRYVKPGVYRLPTFSYNTNNNQRPNEQGISPSLNVHDWTFGSISDDCKKYLIPGYNVYYCKSGSLSCV